MMESSEGLSCFICLFSYLINYSNALTYYVPEEQQAGYFIANIANDTDIRTRISDDDFNSLAYYFLDSDNKYIPYFSINSSTSDLSIKKPLDREEICEYSSEFSCQISLKIAVSSISSFFTRFSVTIFVEDINDNSPYFTASLVELTFLESDVPGTSIPIIGAVDKDSINFSVSSYTISQPDVPFSAEYDRDSESVKIVVAGKLDREDVSHYFVQLTAHDSGTPSLSGSQMINITVQDTNDNPPVFSRLVYNVTVKETVSINTTIIAVSATDRDEGRNAEIGFSLSEEQPKDIRETFEIDSTTGDLKVIGQLVYAPGKVYRVLVTATDNGVLPESSDVYVLVYVEDSENNPPIIKISERSGTTAEVSEYANIGAAVGYVEVTDADDDRNGVISCTTENPNFVLQLYVPKEYKVNVLHRLDYEKQTQHNITIFCHDFGVPQLNSTDWFILTVLDENDNSPIFSSNMYKTTIRENNAIGDLIIQVRAKDDDSGDNGKIQYLVRPNITDFIVDPNTGKIFANKSFNYETEQQVEFEILAFDGGNPQLSGSAIVRLEIEDVNDNIPVFEEDHYTIYIKETDLKEIILEQIVADDEDHDLNGYVSYSLVDVNNTLPFQILPDGTLKTTEKLDREDVAKYEFLVAATDNGPEKKLSSYVNVTVNVADINDNSPVIRYPQDLNVVKYITYMTPVRTQVMTIQAFDLDAGRNALLTYTITQRNDTNLFQMGRNGEIYVARTMNPDDVNAYSLEITVSDQGEDLRSVWTRVTIVVLTKNITTEVAHATDVDGRNVVIAVVVIVVTGVMAASILLIIYIVRRFDLRSKKNAESESGMEQNDRTSSSGFSAVNDKKVKVVPTPVVSHTVLTSKPVTDNYGNQGIDNPVYQNGSPVRDVSKKEITDAQDGTQGQSSQKLHRLASLRLQQALLQSQNKQWPSQNDDFCDPSKNGAVRKQEDLHSDLSADTGTFDSGMGGSVSDTGDIRLAQLQQIVRQSGRRGQPPHKSQSPMKPPRIIARGRSEAPDRMTPRENCTYQSFSPAQMSPAHSPTKIDRAMSPTNLVPVPDRGTDRGLSPVNGAVLDRGLSPSRFSVPASPTKYLTSNSPTKMDQGCNSPTRFSIQNAKVNLAQDLLMYKRFQNGLKKPGRAVVEDSVDTTYQDDDESTTSGSYYIDNPTDDIAIPRVSDIYV